MFSQTQATVPSTEVQQESPVEDNEDLEREESEFPHSMLYIGFIWEIIEFVQSEHSCLISSADAENLASLKAFGTDAQRLLSCLIMRKDSKWHPIRRVLKLGERLGLDTDALERVITELCDNPRFAESQIPLDDALRCLTVNELKRILRDSKPARKDELIAALRQDNSLHDQVYRTLGKCIRLNLDIVRLFRRLILTYYRSKRPPREGAGEKFEITEGIGKRFGAFRPLMFDEPPFIRDREALVEFELRTFPTLANVNINVSQVAVDNYLSIFDDVLGSILPGTDLIIDSCSKLSGTARHVLASTVLRGKTGVSYSDLRKLSSQNVFNPDEDSKAVFIALGDTFCTDEPFMDALDRLRLQDLKVLAKRHLQVKGTKVKSELIKDFERARTQRTINPSGTLEDILMPKIIDKLDESGKRQLLLKEEVKTTLASWIVRYFESRTEPPEYIARRPFLAIRRQFF
ncbi:hypothetical protein MSAN_00449600 [Mycena sanguinolenta]|uniref:Fanconi-associated nuclease n=1 Tax=Mycena sanguinolenta TaxID=230812 RepID=A0A8H6ZB01_9AGAR|nr:hypothetical protein MSAN_00449600 [Mycena sanguinolenta]